jgi:hypothetical protein
MAETPDDIRTQIAQTRARLDNHLETLGAQVEAKKEQLAISAQKWGGIAAVTAGAAGVLMFWPRRRRVRERRRVHAIGRAAV